MKKSYVSNLVLVLMIIILFWYSDNLSTPDIQRNTLTNALDTDIQNIIIKRDNLSDIELHKLASGWQIIQPLQAEANSTRINLLLSLLSTTIHSQLTPTDTESLTQFGLDPIRLSLHLNNHDFLFGDTDPISKHRYILHNETIYLVNDDITPLLNANPASFINNRLLSQSKAMSKIQLPQINEDGAITNDLVTITQIEDVWQSDAEKSADKLNLIIDSWQNAYAIQVLPVTEDELNNVTGLPVTIWYSETSAPLNLLMQTDEKGLFIINPTNKLKYQFPATLKHQLLIDHSKSE